METFPQSVDSQQDPERIRVKNKIITSLQSIVNLYYELETGKYRNQYGDFSAFFAEEEKFCSMFKPENVIDIFNDIKKVEDRDEIIREFKFFFDNTVIYKYANYYNDFPHIVARTVLKATTSMIEKNDISSLNLKKAFFIFEIIERSLSLTHRNDLTNKEKVSLLKLVIAYKHKMSMRESIFIYPHLIELTCTIYPKFKETIESIVDKLFVKKKWGLIESYCKSYSRTISDITFSKLDTYLHKYNLELSNIQQAWGLSHETQYDISYLRYQKRDAYRNDLEMNMEKIGQIESERPGITSLLLHDFGIKEFKRYPSEVLIKQFDLRDKDVPYGIILYSNEDHNQAFDMNRHIIKSIFEQTTEDKLGLRIIEFDSRMDLLKKLIRLNSRYGEKHKIEYIFFGAHGSEDSFSVSEDQIIEKNDFNGKGIKRVKDFLVEKPQIILNSCSTGVEKGIAQEISNTFNATVHAPTIPTNIQDIHLSIIDDKPSFKVTFFKCVCNTFTSGTLEHETQ